MREGMHVDVSVLLFPFSRRMRVSACLVSLDLETLVITTLSRNISLLPSKPMPFRHLCWSASAKAHFEASIFLSFQMFLLMLCGETVVQLQILPFPMKQLIQT